MGVVVLSVVSHGIVWTSNISSPHVIVLTSTTSKQITLGNIPARTCNKTTVR